MSNPLPVHRVESQPTEDRNGTPYRDYVRKVEITDRNPQGPEQAPCHIFCGPVLFDGVMAPAQIAKDSVTIDLGDGGTVVTMHVLAEDVQVGGLDDDGVYTPHLIGGRHVMTPVGEGWSWVPVDPEDPEGFIACSFYVAEVHVR